MYHHNNYHLNITQTKTTPNSATHTPRTNIRSDISQKDLPAVLFPTAMTTHVNSKTETPPIFPRKFSTSIMTKSKLTIQQHATKIPQTSYSIAGRPLPRRATRQPSMKSIGNAKSRSQGSLNKIWSEKSTKAQERKITRYRKRGCRKRKFPLTGMVM